MATEKRLIRLHDLMQFPIRIDHYDKANGNEDFVYGIETVLEYAESLPTVDAVEVVHGRWVIEKRHIISRNPYMDDNYHAHATCSVCGFCIHSENASFGYPKLNTTNYCPNCGARMDGDGDG